MFRQLVSLLCKRNTHWKENFQIPNNNNNKSIKIERICKNKLQLTSGTCTTHITYLWCCDLDIEYWVRQSKCMNEGLSWHACWTSNENFQFTFKPRRKAMVFGSTLLCCENPAYVLYQLSPYNHAAKTPSASRVIYLSILYVFKLNNAKFLSNLELQNCKLLNSSAWRPSWFPFSSQTSSVVAHSSLIDLSSVNKHDCDQTKKICKRLFRVTFDA